jgi:hypothetical protein
VGDHGQEVVLHLVGLLELAGHLLLLDPQLGLPPGRGLGVLAGHDRPALAAQQQVGGEHRAEGEQQQGRALGRQDQDQHADLGHDHDQQQMTQEPGRADRRPHRLVQVQVHPEQGHLDDDEHRRPGQDRRQGRAAGDRAAGQGRPDQRPGGQADRVDAAVEGDLDERLSVGQVVEQAGGGHHQRRRTGPGRQDQGEDERRVHVDAGAAPVPAERDRQERRDQHHQGEHGPGGQAVAHPVEVNAHREQYEHHEADRRDDGHVRPEPAHHRASLPPRPVSRQAAGMVDSRPAAS